MHVDGDERGDDLAVQPGEVLANHRGHILEVRSVLFQVLLHSRHRVFRFKALDDAAAPVNLRNHDHNLRGLVAHPIGPRLLGIAHVRLLALLFERGDHGSLHGCEPLLNVATSLQIFPELHPLPLRTEHGEDVHALGVLAKVEGLDTIEALGHVRLHGLHVLGLGQNLEQLVVGEEIKPRETHALRLQVLLQVLLDEV